MRKIIYSALLLGIIIFSSCSKSSTTPSDSNVPFNYTSLVASDTVMPLNGIANITATATGSGLTYKWTASYGTFIGSGAAVKWTVCHSDIFTITCVIKDNNGHEGSKTISINVR
jgi:PBP1b-binding outer membrane lipoprotein LpoB